jgi:predicted RNA-binding protein associated with RNAse of E/G family
MTGAETLYAGTIHAPKHETFDLDAGTNTDPKGIVRAVDVYTRQPWGLYMARPTPGRVQFHYLESWLLPTLGLRANIFHWNAGHEREQDFYLDIAEITVAGDIWRTVDHYLDLIVCTGQRTELIDVDELLEAHQMGLIPAETAERAILTAVAAVDGLAKHGHDLHAWLGGNEMDLTWR